MRPTREQEKNLIQLEGALQRYFDSQIAPIMQQVENGIRDSAVKELKERHDSLRGKMENIAFAANPHLSAMGIEMGEVWNSHTSEELFDGCRSRIQQSKTVSHDLGVLADAWRTEVKAAIGQERYDELSKKLGTDMAVAYTGYRMEKLMYDRLVERQVPQNTAEYLMQRMAEENIYGIPQEMKKSELDRQISEDAHRQYAPSKTERATGKLLGIGADVLSTGGYNSWSSLGRLALTELGVSGAMLVFSKSRGNEKEITVEEYISQGVFGEKRNLLAGYQKEAKGQDILGDSYLSALDRQMGGRMKILSKDRVKELDQYFQPAEQWTGPKVSYASTPKAKGAPVVPLCVRPGAEEAYCREEKERKQKNEERKEQQQEESLETSEMKDGKENKDTDEGMVVLQEEEIVQPEGRQEGSGWGDLLSSIGLNDMGGVGKNLGYVIAMLPERLLGMLTGKSKNLNIKENLMPIASVLMGLFVKNPILKMLLISMGGLNLFNKAGHETLAQKNGTEGVEVGRTEKVNYRQYADEVLNPRVSQPQIKGGMLVCNVDQVPCSVRLPKRVVDAYEAGALPLNTLVNAVLAKNDEMQSRASSIYEASQQQESRTRGIV